MTRRNKLITLLVAFLLFIVLAVLTFLLRLPDRTPGDMNTETQAEQGRASDETVPPTPAEAERMRSNELGLGALAKTFAERYGSFSFESEFENMRDVMPLMTDAYAAATAAELAAKKASEVFYSATTRVIATSVDALSEEEGVATITVTTQREIVSDDPGNRTVRYQPLLLTFEKIKGVWKVASARWQEE